MSVQAVLVGAGDLGWQIGVRLHEAGYAVTAVRRRAELVEPPLRGVAGDVNSGLPPLPGLTPEVLVVCLTAGARDAARYREVFIDGVGRVLSDVQARGWEPRRALFVSSTAVCAERGEVTESTPAAPSSATGAVLREAEERFVTGLPAATRGIVIRPSGIYGPGRRWFIEQVRRGEVRDPHRMTHRVYRDDVARAAVHLLTMDAEPEELYLVTDDAPVPAGDVAAYIAEQLNLSEAVSGPPSAGMPGDVSTTSAAPRILRNDRLHASGFEFSYPTYREGYAAVLAQEG